MNIDHIDMVTYLTLSRVSSTNTEQIGHHVKGMTSIIHYLLDIILELMHKITLKDH